jgi:hypothetical protein
MTASRVLTVTASTFLNDRAADSSGSISVDAFADLTLLNSTIVGPGQEVRRELT